MIAESNEIMDIKLNESLNNLFNEISEKMKFLDIKLDNKTLLKFYGLYKVATVGEFEKNSNKNISMLDFTGKLKK